MWQKLKEQLPAVIITVILVLLGYVLYINQKVLPDLSAKQEAELKKVKDQNAAELHASAEETRRQIDGINTLLKDAIAKRQADVFMNDEELAKVNAAKADQLAELIAKKIQPYNPLPKSPEEAEQLQNDQADKVGGRIATRIAPILEEMSKQQSLTKESIADYSRRISDQVGGVITSQMATNQQLNNNLMQTQAAAQDAMRLSQEITALYLSSFKDQSLITRILSLPVNVVKDATSLSIVNSSERKKIEERLMGDMASIQKRLSDLQAQQPTGIAKNNPPAPQLSSPTRPTTETTTK